MLSWIKSFFSSTDDDELYRAEFERSQIQADSCADLSRTNGQYDNPSMESSWQDRLYTERKKGTAW
jgi:hypothetical protein